jgi:outer membrane receptor protein involved in Fe transport
MRSCPVPAASPNDSGKVEFTNSSPGIGLAWLASNDINVYGNLGRGFETPTLTETAYRVGATGPNGRAPMHSLFAQLEYKPKQDLRMALEMRAESKAYANDVNSDAAPGYAVFNLRAGQEFRIGSTALYLYGRLDKLLDKNYAGSVIVNDANGRFFEPAGGRRFFFGVRASMPTGA